MIKKLFLVFLSGCCFQQSYAQNPNFQWVQNIGAAASGGYGFSDAKYDNQGNLYVIGHLQGTLDFDIKSTMEQKSGYFDTYVAKYAPDHTLLWFKKLEGSQVSNHTYLGYNRIYGKGLAVNNGKIAITGEYYGTIDMNLGAAIDTISSLSKYSPFVALYDTSFNYQWAFGLSHTQFIGSSPNPYGKSVEMDASGNVFVAGAFYKTMDCDPSAATATLASDSSFKNYLSDIFVCKYSPTGSFTWAKRLGGSGHSTSIKDDIFTDMILDNAGNVLVSCELTYNSTFQSTYIPAGSFDDQAPAVVKIDPNGNFLWAKAYVGKWASDIAVDSGNNVYFQYWQYAIGTTRFVKFNSAGTLLKDAPLWRTYKSTSIFVDNADKIYITGQCTTGVDLLLDDFVTTSGSGYIPLISGTTKNDYYAKYDSSFNFISGGVLDATNATTYGESFTFVRAFQNRFSLIGKTTSTLDINSGSGTYNFSNGYNYIATYDSSNAFLMGGGPENSEVLSNAKENITATVYKNGFVYASGWFSGKLDLDHGPGETLVNSYGRDSCGFICKYDTLGNFIWGKAILTQISGSTYSNMIEGLDVDNAGNVFISGSKVNSICFGNVVCKRVPFIAKYGPNGDSLFTHVFSVTGSTSEGNAIQVKVDQSGNIVVIGDFKGTIDLDPGTGTASYTSLTNIGGSSSDIFVAKYSNTGNYISSFSLGGSQIDYVSSLALDPSDNIIISGYSSQGSSLDFNPGSGTNNGAFTLPSKFVAKYTSNGTYVWHLEHGAVIQVNSGDGEYVYYSPITTDALGNIFMTGYNDGKSFGSAGNQIPAVTVTDRGTFLAKYSPNGILSFVKFAGGYYGNAIATDANNDVYLTGRLLGFSSFNAPTNTISLTSNGTDDIFISKFSSTGTNIWAQKVGSFYSDGVKQEQGTAIATDPNGGLYVGGMFTQNGIFDNNNPTNFTNSGIGINAFLLKLKQNLSVPVTTCSGAQTLTACNQSFEDGSAGFNYGNNQSCSWLIQTGSSSITLNFTSFNTESGNDLVRVYDGTSAAAPLLGTYSGSTLPPSLNSTSGALFITFTTNASVTSSGFAATYTCNNVLNPPIAQISPSTFNIQTGQTVTFTDQSSNTPTTWQWSFPGGTPSSSTNQNPTITYNTPGCYDYTLIVANADGADTVTVRCGIYVSGSNACSELYFSEYLEGTSNNKVLEIFNPSSNAINLSGYKVELYNNGASTANTTLNLSGILYANKTYVICNTTSIASIIAIADTISSVCSFNGNDAVVLKKNNVSIDAIGIVGNNPGTSWTWEDGGNTMDKTLVRKRIVTAGNTNWNACKYEFEILPQNNFTTLGNHDSYCVTGVEMPVAQVSANLSFDASNQAYVCPNTCVSFKDSSLNAPNAWEWSFPGATPSTSSAQNPTNICYNTPGSYDVMLIAYSEYGVDSILYPNMIQVYGIDANAGLDTTICEGESIMLNAAGGNTYVWNTDASLSATNTSNPIATPTVTTTYTVTTFYATCQETDQVTVTVKPLPNASITQNQNTLSASAGSSYQWYDCNLNQIIAGETNQNFTPTNDGSYAVMVGNNGCSDTSACFNFILMNNLLSIQEAVLIYPNPTQDLITLDYTLAQQTNIQWNITDLAGKIVLNGNIDQTSKGKTQIHLNSLTDGVYILNIQTPFGNKTEKLVKN